jgi:hypothetical protein
VHRDETEDEEDDDDDDAQQRKIGYKRWPSEELEQVLEGSSGFRNDAKPCYKKRSIEAIRRLVAQE